MKKLQIVFIDELGACAVSVDDYGVNIQDSIAYFSGGGIEYRVPVWDILSIGIA